MCEPQGGVHWRAGRDVAADEEIRISYGPLSDGELLLTYGFVEALPAPEVNWHNKVVLAESDVFDAAKVFPADMSMQLRCLSCRH